MSVDSVGVLITVLMLALITLGNLILINSYAKAAVREAISKGMTAVHQPDADELPADEVNRAKSEVIVLGVVQPNGRIFIKQLEFTHMQRKEIERIARDTVQRIAVEMRMNNM